MISSSPSLRLCLIEGWWNPHQWSMPLYCDEIAFVLRDVPGMEILRVRPRRRGPSLAHRWARRWAQGWDLPQQLAGIQADIFHCVEPGDVWAARRLDPARLIVTCHDLIPWRLRHLQRGTWRARLGISDLSYRKMWEKLRRVARIITPSERTRQDALEYTRLPQERVTVVPHWLNPAFRPMPQDQRASARKEIGASFKIPEGFWFLHVGSVDFYKNIETLLTAFAQVQRLYPHRDVFLLRVGSRLTADHAKLAERLSIRHRVFELGHLGLKDLAKAYACSDTFVFPSWYEGFGRPALEALASGLPVITAKAGALPEVVEDAALLVDSSDAAGLAAAMQRMLEDPPSRKQLTEAGARRVAAYRAIDVSGNLLRVYRETLKIAGRP